MGTKPEMSPSAVAELIDELRDSNLVELNEPDHMPTLGTYLGWVRRVDGTVFFVVRPKGKEWESDLQALLVRPQYVKLSSVPA